MEIIHKIKESESIVIEGDKKIGKMMLSLFLTQSIHTAFLSPFSANKVRRRLLSAKKNFSNISFDRLSVFSFREDWVIIKNEYGFSYLLQDFEFFISQQQSDIIIIHRIDSIFEYSDRDFIEDFFIELLSFGIKHKKKLLFTINIDSVNYDLISSNLAEASDLYLKMSRKQDIREIEILFSISPIVDSHYIFTNVNNKLRLETKDLSSYSKKEIDIVVISKDETLRKLHKYILEKEDINLRIIDSISDSLSIVSNIPDFLIFIQEFDEINFNICEISKKNNFKTMYIVQKPFVRVDDRLLGRKKGCVDVISSSMQTMHYVLELEKFFGVVFYKSNLINMEIKLKTKHDFLKYIQFLLKEKVLFTIVKINGQVDADSFKILRKYDQHMIFETYSVLILLNLLKEEVTKILHNKIKDDFAIQQIQDCIEISNGEKICID